MQELRAAGLALDVQPHKMDRLTTALSPWFELVSESGVSEVLPLPLETVSSLIGMGPSAHHRQSAAEVPSASPEPVQPVTASFSIALFRRAASR
jgi:hypothetical protein